jgi:DNA-binding HxlR family transcriptional regulator
VTVPAPGSALDGAVEHPGDAPTQLAAGAPNAVAHSLGIIGDEWTLLILRYATAGIRRYSEYLERLPISNSVLTNRLSRLAEVGLMEKVAYQQRPPRFEYRLTKRGRDTWPILLAIWAWEARWVPQHEENLPVMRHSRCGQAFQPLLTCAACGKAVEPREVTGGFGPSGTWERSVPAATTRRRSFAAGGAVSPGLFPQTMALIGNRWSSALLGAAFLGAHRFKDFEQRLGAPPTMVADRLRTFCDLGVLRSAPGTERADWLSYHLTAKGRAFFAVVMCTLDWGHRWFKAPEGRALVYRHTDCRRIFTPRLACDQCREPLRGGSDVTIERTP